MISPSFLRPPGTVITRGSWAIRAGGKPIDGHLAKGWSYATPVAVTFSCNVDLPALLESVALASEAALNLVLRWHSTNTGLRGVGDPQRVEQGQQEVRLSLGGDSLGGVLALEAVIVLAAAPGDRGPLAPTRPGSILWTEAMKVVLEGEGQRFPVQLVSFNKAGIRGAGAAWCLRWDSTDYDQAPGACLRIQLNRDNDKARAAAENPTDPGNAALMQVLRWDIAKQMVMAALDDESGFETLDWPGHTLGAAMAARVRTVLPGLSLDECRTLRRTSPEDFETSLQATMGLFG